MRGRKHVGLRPAVIVIVGRADAPVSPWPLRLQRAAALVSVVGVHWRWWWEIHALLRRVEAVADTGLGAYHFAVGGHVRSHGN